MLQELFRIPGLDWPVYGYGLMLVLGVYAAIELGRFLANRVGMNGDHFVTLGLLALAAGVFGARLSHVLENLELYTREDRSFWANLKAAANLSSGGLTFYGGFIFAFLVLALYGWWRKIPIRLSMDVVAPCLMLGLAFGRVGCLLNGCCWGATCDPERVPWAITFPYDSPPYNQQYADGEIDVPPPPLLVEGSWVGSLERGLRPELMPREELRGQPELQAMARNQRSLPVHPAQVYSVINALLIMGVSLAYFTLRRSAGQVFALMLILYSIGRFLLETLRVEPAVPLLGLDPGFSFSMWVAIFTLATGIILWLAFQRFYIPAPPAAVAASPAGEPRAAATA